MIECKHLDCQDAYARELTELYDRTGEWRYLCEAVDMFARAVACRQSSVQVARAEGEGS